MNAQFKINVRWLENAGSFDDPAESATAAHIQILVDGVNICRSDKAEAIEWHALSIAEWICENWEKTLFSSKPPLPLPTDSGVLYEQMLQEKLDSWPVERAERVAEKKFSWWKSHNIRGGRQGGAFPEMVFWPHGNRMEISWLGDPEVFARTNIKFISQPGRAFVSLVSVIGEFREFLRTTARRLDELAVHTERAENLREKIAALDSERTRLKSVFELLGISAPAFQELVGLSASEMSSAMAESDQRGNIWQRVNAALRLGADAAAPSYESVGEGSAPIALFRSINPHLTIRDIQELKRKCVNVPRNEFACAKLVELAEKTERRLPDVSGATPYTVGYVRAKKFRSVLQQSANKRFDVERFISEGLRIQISSCDLSDRHIDAVSLWDNQSGPIVSINKTAALPESPWGRRMALAHELCHLLFDSAHGRKLGVASGPWAPNELEQTANAFAAELLVPESGLDQFNYAPLRPAGLKRICDHYGVGHTVVANRLADLEKVSKEEAESALNGLYRPGKTRRARHRR